MMSEELKSLIVQADTALETIRSAFSAQADAGGSTAELEAQLSDLKAKTAVVEAEKESLVATHEEALAAANANTETVRGRLARVREQNEELRVELDKANENYAALVEQRSADLKDVDQILEKLAPLVEGE